MTWSISRMTRMAGYVCRGCGTVCNNTGAYIRCPVCGI